jgi:hypothetical protein
MKQLIASERQRQTVFLRPYIATIVQQPWFTFFAMVATNALLVAGILVLEFRYGVDHWNFVRDTNAIAGLPAFFGSYSSLGILIWAAAASIALFSWRALAHCGIADAHARALRLGGSFAAVACLDDLFMLHEHAYLVGIPETIVMAGYALFLIAFVVSTIPILHTTCWLLLGGAVGCLALSVLFDLTYFRGSVLLEEVFKLSGISFLAAYLVTLSFSALAAAELPAGRTMGPKR